MYTLTFVNVCVCVCVCGVWNDVKLPELVLFWPKNKSQERKKKHQKTFIVAEL